MVVISIYWSITASINEVSLNYDVGRETAKFIKDNDLDEFNIFVAWRTIKDQETETQKYYYNQTLGISTLAYFDENIFSNFNKKSNYQCYDTHKIDNIGYHTNNFIDDEYPEVLIGTDNTAYTFGTNKNMNDFVLIKSIDRWNIWKDKVVESKQLIYMRRDLIYKNTKFIDNKKIQLILLRIDDIVRKLF